MWIVTVKSQHINTNNDNTTGKILKVRGKNLRDTAVNLRFVRTMSNVRTRCELAILPLCTLSNIHNMFKNMYIDLKCLHKCIYCAVNITFFFKFINFHK